MDATTMRRRVEEARVARFATVTDTGRPHLVPCCFALVGSTIYTAVDAKPKSAVTLRRIANIVGDPRVSLLIDHYAEDWSTLWWVRLDGTARLIGPGEEQSLATEALVAKYHQYRRIAIPGPVVAIEVDTWRSWP
jgi:PPOX class probable F420-dependent enzyme